MSILSEFKALVDQEIRRMTEDLLWRYRLDLNEMLHGSAYGPWLPPRLEGLESVVSPGGRAPVDTRWVISGPTHPD